MIREMRLPQSTIKSETLPVNVPVDGVDLAGDLCVPPNAKGIVVFAHGSGSSRFSPRNRFVAEVLHEHAVGTLLIDLLTPEEERIDEQTRELRFDIPLLAGRLEKIGAWVLARPRLRDLKLGYFGASTGGAAALIAAAAQPDKMAAVVSRGGRPDLADEFLPQVQAPTLLIVGGHDPQVLEWNKEALALLNKRSRLEIVPRATHLFEEPGALETVAQLAANWFAGLFA
ncbi:MAG TPA: alpha/beta hydrolase [Alphaproteobacteria bacterium]|nr:alpha/beta hydrolase [Alphaproteobacteria bacterium]